MEDKEIDKYEQNYILAVAKANKAVKEKENINAEDICNLAKFKEMHPELFSGENTKSTADDLNYYVIPKKVKQKMRNGNEEILVDKNAYMIVDSSGNSLGLILEENGIVIKDFERAQKEVSIDENQKDISNDGKDEIKTVGDIVDKKDQDNINRVYEEAKEIGIEPKILDQILEKRNCNVDQINMREIKNVTTIQEDTGIILNSAYENRAVAIRIDYGSEYKYYLIDKQTGNFLNPKSIDGRGENIPEVQDYFKYRFRPGVEESLPLRKDEDFTYISYLDESTSLKRIKYMNNGQEEDMIKAERELYTDEVEKANLALQQAIDEYQQINTQENWLRVKNAMQKRVEIDQKYRVLENQRELTGKTLEETKEETIERYKPEEREEEDDPRMRGGRY